MSLYLFQNLPIYFLSFFKQMDSIILSFVWANKPPRNSKAHLQKDVNRDGLGLPVFRHYYWAANARALTLAVGGSLVSSILYLHHNIVNVHP